MEQNTQKKNYRQLYLEDFISLTGISDLTLQDVRGAMELLFRAGLLERQKSPWSKWQFELLYRKLLDTANPYNKVPEAFKVFVDQTRRDRVHRPKKEMPEEEEIEYHSDEEDMEKMSQELLDLDDISYDGK